MAMREPRLRRSLLFVPGGEPRKHERARTSGADTILFDLEDSVAPEAKAAAREHVATTLRAGGFGESEAAVRVNALATPYAEADIEAVVSAGCRALLIPKCEAPDDVARAARLLDALETRGGEAARDGVCILALIETARGLARALDIAEASVRVEALCFGHVDLAADVRVPAADPSAGTLLHARCQIVLAARAAGRAPIDTVHVGVRDAAACRADVALGVRLGFDGKLCIHPSQVALVHEAYTPTAVEIDYAGRVLGAWREAERMGRGVVAVDGAMVDRPVVEAQRRVLARARRAGLVVEDPA